MARGWGSSEGLGTGPVTPGELPGQIALRSLRNPGWRPVDMTDHPAKEIWRREVRDPLGESHLRSPSSARGTRRDRRKESGPFLSA